MLIIDNTNHLKTLLEFQPNTYYKFVAMKRYKDRNKNQEETNGKHDLIIRQWLVDSEMYLNQCLSDMLNITDILGCRLYLNLNRKSVIKSLINLRNKTQEQLDFYLNNNNLKINARLLDKMVHSVTSLESSDSRNADRFMFDIDNKDSELANMVKELCGPSYIDTLQTKNGYHIIGKLNMDIRKKFNEFLEDYQTNSVDDDIKEIISLKTNSMTLIAMGE